MKLVVDSNYGKASELSEENIFIAAFTAYTAHNRLVKVPRSD